MKTLITLIAICFGIGVANAAGNYPSLAPGAEEAAPETSVVPPFHPNQTPPAPGKEMDYSDRPVVQWNPGDYTKLKDINMEKAGKASWWLNTKALDPVARTQLVHGMIVFETPQNIMGVGTQISRIFSTAVLNCDRGIFVQLNDVYTTLDSHVVGFHRQAPSQGIVPLTDMKEIFEGKVCQEPKSNT